MATTNPSLQTTLVAAFRDASDAQAAVKDLDGLGVRRDQVQVVANDATTNTTVGEGYAPQHEGGFKGWLKSIFGGDEAEHAQYEGHIAQGNTIVTVHTTDDHIDSVADILNRHRPIEIHEEAAHQTAGLHSSTTPLPTAQVTNTAAARDTALTGKVGETSSTPVIKEELSVGKRTVLRGGVRVYSRIVEEPVQADVTLRDEKVFVDRQPVNRAVDARDLRAGQEQVIEVKEYAEEAVVGKQARVTEEIRVGKNATEHTETIHDTVRHTEVDVQPISADATTTAHSAPGTDMDDADYRRFYDTNYGTSGVSYDTYRPAFQYGFESRNDPRYRGKDFDEIETNLRSDYNTRYPNGNWDRMKDSVRYGWNRMTGRK